MDNMKNSKNKIIWLSVLILFICVAATTLAFADIMNIFMPSDEGAISLISGDAPERHNASGEDAVDQTAKLPTDNTSELPADAGSQTSESVNVIEGDASLEDAKQQMAEVTAGTEEQSAESVKEPNIEFSDDKTVWGTDTKIELFKVSYENGKQVITVKSDNGDKLIAPGTENTYTFKLKNTGNVALDYTLEIVAYCTPEGIEIPITGRICRYDGEWVAGGKEEYVSVEKLNEVTDSATLGAGKYTYYTVDWQWLFESGNDEFDTLLGNMAKDEDVSFTIVIKTTATESDDPNADDGIIPPKTGDDSHLTLWIILMIGSFVMLFLLLFTNKKEKRRAESEEDNS